MNKVQRCSHLLAPLFENHEENVNKLVKLISDKMNKWSYYQISDGSWMVCNEETIQFFQTDYESDAKWLTDKLNDSERITRFDDGIALTDEGDLVKVKDIPDGGSGDLYRRVNGYE